MGRGQNHDVFYVIELRFNQSHVVIVIKVRFNKGEGEQLPFEMP